MNLARTIFLAGLMLMACRGQAEDRAPLRHEIPKNAVKIGPLPSKEGWNVYDFYKPGSEFLFKSFENFSAELADKARLGTKTYAGNLLIKEELFKEGKKDGMDRTWHKATGAPSSEESYSNGVMHGRFKHWSENGQLVGSYQMTNGAGRKQIYDTDGKLICDQEFSNNVCNGFFMEVSPINHIRSIGWQKDDKFINHAFSFYKSGKPRLVYFYSESGELHGPQVTFTESGALQEIAWYVRGQEISEAEYAALAGKDEKLPPIFGDGNRYKEFTSEVSKLLEQYKTAKPIRIPLEFGKNGKPMLR